MRGYLRVLAERDFRRLWLGASVSLVGDGMTFVALAWLVLDRPGGTRQLGLLADCYTAPVLLGGLTVGSLLDRFDKRVVLAADSLLRGAAAVTPLLAGGAIGAAAGLMCLLAGLPALGLLLLRPVPAAPASSGDGDPPRPIEDGTVAGMPSRADEPDLAKDDLPWT